MNREPRPTNDEGMAIRRDRLIKARKRLALGDSLKEAAEWVGANPERLDLALWYWIGRGAWYGSRK